MYDVGSMSLTDIKSYEVVLSGVSFQPAVSYMTVAFSNGFQDCQLKNERSKKLHDAEIEHYYVYIFSHVLMDFCCC